MKTIAEFKERDIRVVLTDIDGTLTQNGRLPANSYKSLWQLAEAGLQVIPVTGRPAGWCEMIARLWPVHGVVGENGAFFFSLKQKKMQRHFLLSGPARKENRENLKKIRQAVLASVQGAAIASDQFSRLFDLAVDFSEDVPPLPEPKIDQIVEIFHQHGAHAKVSNIHVNGWFGNYNKVSTCQTYLKKEFKMTAAQMRQHCIFVGDSPNDEPMFEFFPHSFAVANIRDFLSRLKHKPTYVAKASEADGFVEVANRLLVLNTR